MVKEVHYQLEKFAKYSLNNIVDYRFVKILLYFNKKTQIFNCNCYLNLFKPITTNELQYSLKSSYISNDRTSQPKVGG